MVSQHSNLTIMYMEIDGAEKQENSLFVTKLKVFNYMEVEHMFVLIHVVVILTPPIL